MIKPYDVHVKLTLKMSRFRVHTLLRNFSYRQYFRHVTARLNQMLFA